MTDTDLTKMSTTELAQYKKGFGDDHERSVLVEKEFERRARIEQHELDLRLIKKQSHWMLIAAIIGIIGTLLGAVVGAVLQAKLPSNQKECLSQSSKYQVEKSIVLTPSVQDKTINVKSSAKESSLKNAK